MTVATAPDPLLLAIVLGATMVALAVVQWIIEGPDPVRLAPETVARIVGGRSGWREAQP